MPSQPPRVFISYSHDSPEHAQHVLELAERLRKDGIDAQLKASLPTLTGHSDRVTAVAVTPNGRLADSAARNKTLRVWELETGQPVGTLQRRGEWLPAVAI
jgi:WD40 repeat protein